MSDLTDRLRCFDRQTCTEAAERIETLEAELAAMRAGGEPVAEMVPCYTPSGKRVAVISRFQHLPIGTKLYTSPPAVAGEQTMADVIAACNGTEAFGLIMGLRAQVAMLEAVIDEQKASAKSQPTQAQAGAVPLTDERLDVAVEAWFVGDNNYDFRERMRAAIDAAHGIKGGQHDI